MDNNDFYDYWAGTISGQRHNRSEFLLAAGG
jgi:hypothetical protein